MSATHAEEPGARRWSVRRLSLFTHPWRYAVAVAALTLVAAALRLPTLDAASVWFDEAVTLALLRMELPDMLVQIPRGESTPPLYYLVAWAWARIAGQGEVPVRALSALAGIATVPVLYAGVAHLATRRIGLAVASLAAVSPLLVWHSLDARAYALLVLLSAVSLLAFARALDEPSPGRLGLWALAAALALLTHYFAVFPIAAEAAWLLLKARPRRRVALGVAVPLVIGAALLPLALAQLAHGGAAWLAERPLGARTGDLWPHFLAGYGAAPGPLASYESGSPPGLTIAAAALGVIALGLAAFVAVRAVANRRTAGGDERDASGERRGLGVASALVLTGLGVPLLLTLAGLDYVLTRNLLPAWIAIALLAGVGIGSRRTGAIGAVVGVSLCAVLAAVTVTAAASPRFGPDDWNAVARGLGGPRAERVVLAPASIAMPLALARPGLATLPAAGVRVKEINVLRRGGAKRRPPARGFRLARRRVVGESFTLFRFRSARPALVTPEMLLGESPVRRRRSAVMYAPAVGALGRARTQPPVLAFCDPAPDDTRVRITIRTPCATAYPEGE